MSSVDHCLAYLAKLPPAISGSGGHNATMRAACECVRFGLSDDEAMRAMADFNQRCQPPWSERELAHKLADARKLAGAQLHTRVATRSGRGMARTFDHGALDRALASKRARRPAMAPGFSGQPPGACAVAALNVAPPAGRVARATEPASAMRAAFEAVVQLPGYELGLPVVCQSVDLEEVYWRHVWQSIGRPDPSELINPGGE